MTKSHIFLLIRFYFRDFHSTYTIGIDGEIFFQNIFGGGRLLKTGTIPYPFHISCMLFMIMFNTSTISNSFKKVGWIYFFWCSFFQINFLHPYIIIIIGDGGCQRGGGGCCWDVVHKSFRY